MQDVVIPILGDNIGLIAHGAYASAPHHDFVVGSQVLTNIFLGAPFSKRRIFTPWPRRPPPP